MPGSVPFEQIRPNKGMTTMRLIAFVDLFRLVIQLMSMQMLCSAGKWSVYLRSHSTLWTSYEYRFPHPECWHSKRLAWPALLALCRLAGLSAVDSPSMLAAHYGGRPLGVTVGTPPLPGVNSSIKSHTMAAARSRQVAE